MSETETGIKNGLKHFNLERWTCLQQGREGKATDRGFGGKDLKLDFDHVLLEMSSR